MKYAKYLLSFVLALAIFLPFRLGVAELVQDKTEVVKAQYIQYHQPRNFRNGNNQDCRRKYRPNFDSSNHYFAGCVHVEGI